MGPHSATCHPTQVNAPAFPQPDRPVLDLPTPEGLKAELTLVAGYIPKSFTCPLTVTHPMLVIIPRLHDQAGSTSCYMLAMDKPARCLLDVCWMIASCRLCFMHALYLLHVCSMFARSCKRGIDSDPTGNRESNACRICNIALSKFCAQANST